MPDFDRTVFDLSAPARKVLSIVDDAIALYASRGRPMQRIILFKAQWDALNRSLHTQSKGEVTLRTHTYRGVKLVGPPKGIDA